MSADTVAAAKRRREGLDAIRADEALPLDLFYQKTGLSRHALRAAQKAGLRVRRAHTRAYVLGSDWIEYLRATEGI